MWFVDWLRDLISSFLSGLGLLNKDATIILIGLDNAGKSTLLHKLAKGAFGSFPPTERPGADEFQVQPTQVIKSRTNTNISNEKFQVGGVSFKAWDLGGHEAVRHVWDDFLPTTDAVVFVVDSADRSRLAEVETELSALAVESSLFAVPIAVLFNKEDLPFSMATSELEVALKWTSLCQRDGPIKHFRTSVISGAGYTEALQWVASLC